MKVSRDDVSYTSIIEYPVRDRFLKLPVKGFLGVEGVEPIAPQIAMINAVENPLYRFITACLSRRTGKTFIANALAFLKVLEPNVNVLIVSPNYSLTNISWNEQIALFDRHKVELVTRNKQDRELHLENGSMVKFGSIANANALVGRSYDLIIFDEAALDRRGLEAFNIQLRPTLDKPNSKCIFISTPRGKNYFHDLYQRGFAEDYPAWVSIHSTYQDNPRMNEDDVAEARKSMSKAEFAQEYLAEFTTFEGQIYDAFDASTHVADLTEMDFVTDRHRYETIMGIDPGYKDATGAVIIKYDNRLQHYYIIWDYELSERTTEKHAKAFRDAFDRYGVDIIYCDSAAAQFRQDMAVGYDLPSSKSKKSVLDGISFVQSLIESGKVTVCTSCSNIIMMFTNYRWDSRENLAKATPEHDSFSHLADAVRYALYSYRV